MILWNCNQRMKEKRKQEEEAAMSQKPHTHIDENGNVITHTHDEKHVRHSHYHDPEEKKRQLNRISRAIGHLNHVKSMIENDRDCADVLTQLSAVDSALRGLGKEIITASRTPSRMEIWRQWRSSRRLYRNLSDCGYHYILADICE